MGKVNMGKMTNSIAKAQSRKPLHLRNYIKQYIVIIDGLYKV